MAPRRSLAAAAALSGALAPGAHGQPARPAEAAAPRFLNMVYQTLRPGRETAYREMLGAIARAYARLEIPAYWVELRSMTGRPTMLSLNLFDSFEQADRAIAGMRTVLPRHPDLQQLQSDLLTSTTDEETVLTVRRDDLGAPSPAINLSTAMRLLRVTTVAAAPGQESALAGALRAACAALASTSPGGPCLVYEADADVGHPTFVLLTPLLSLADVESDIVGRHGLMSAPTNSAAGSSRSPADLTLAACSTACTAVESQIYVVNPELSHMPVAFTAGDPAYWTPTLAKQVAPR